MARLAGLGLVSAYHEHHREEQGAETRPTQYQYRHAHRPFHLDHVFIPDAWRARVHAVEVGQAATWLCHSDYMPVVVDVDLGGLP